jgi:hypothetical protein
MEEIWKDIEGFEGKYQISNTNKVKSNHFGKSIILKPALNTGGYNSVSLSLNNKAKSVTLHRLIMTAFIANPDNKPCINHIDGNKLNNSLSNLEWCTYSENLKHAYDNELKLPIEGKGEKSSQHKLKEEDVLKIRASNLSSKELGTLYNVNRTNIIAIRKRKSWTHI